MRRELTELTALTELTELTALTADARAGKLIEAGLALASELSLPTVLQRIVDLATEVTGARYGALGVIGPDGWLVEFVTTGVTPAERAASGPRSGRDRAAAARPRDPRGADP